jgi:hypothetical protein
VQGVGRNGGKKLPRSTGCVGREASVKHFFPGGLRIGGDKFRPRGCFHDLRAAICQSSAPASGKQTSRGGARCILGDH